MGRYKTAEESGRYTAPIPKSVRHSPPWFGVLILVLLIGGVAVITVNYLAHLPFMAHGSPWGLVIGLVMIFAGFLLRHPLSLNPASRPALAPSRRVRQPSRSMTVAFASPPPSHIVRSP